MDRGAADPLAQDQEQFDHDLGMLFEEGQETAPVKGNTGDVFQNPRIGCAVAAVEKSNFAEHLARINDVEHHLAAIGQSVSR